MDLSSRDYDIKEIGPEDPRLLDCKKEGLFVQILALVITVTGCILAYLLSPSTEEVLAGVKVVSFMGYPLWALVPAGLFLLQTIIMIICALKVFKRPSLEAKMSEDDETGGK